VSELSEQEQWERAKEMMGELWIYIVGGLALGGIALWGWGWNHKRIETRAQNASMKYEEVIDAFSRNDKTRAMTLVDELNRDFSATPYAALGTLIAARAHVEANELEQAATGLKTVMASASDQELRMIARMRLARVLAAQAKYDDALAMLKVEDVGEFAPRFADARGDVLLAKGDRDGALREYLAARSGEDNNSVDVDLLDLKIRDLGGTPPKAPEESAPQES
jgi:predicted negative regulator of RcsB-dependent stress response